MIVEEFWILYNVTTGEYLSELIEWDEDGHLQRQYGMQPMWKEAKRLMQDHAINLRNNSIQRAEDPKELAFWEELAPRHIITRMEV